MKSYRKETAIFGIKDFFRDYKWLLIADFCFFTVGFVLAVIFGEVESDAEYAYSRIKSVLWCVMTATIAFCLLLSATFTKYLSVMIPLAFILIGVRAGRAAEFLCVAAGIKGVFNFLSVYLPIIMVIFICANCFTAVNMPYLSSAPNSRSFPNRACGMKTILKRFAILFCACVLFAVLWILILGLFLDVIYCKPV